MKLALPLSIALLALGAVTTRGAPQFMTLPFKDDGCNLQQGWRYMANVGGGIQYGIDYVEGGVDNSSSWVAFAVVAAADGDAIYRPGYNGGLGNYVSVEHAVDGHTYYSFYCHLYSSSIATDRRVSVRRGDALGTTGTSGAANGVNHLHFEVHDGDESKSSRVDPYDICGVRTDYPPCLNKRCGSNRLWTTDPPSRPNIDGGPPSISWGGAPTGRWYNDLNMQVVNWRLSDSESGVEGFGQAWDVDPILQYGGGSSSGCLALGSIPASQREGQHIANVHAWDIAGNDSNNTRGWYGCDLTPPSVNITAGPTAGVWLNASTVRRVDWHVSDGLSGARGFGQAWDSTPLFQFNSQNGYLNPPEGSHMLHVHAYDNADNGRGDPGNDRDWTFGPYMLDTGDPSASVSISPSSPSGSNGWYTARPSFTVSASDAISGVEHLYYRLDGGTCLPYTAPVPLPDGVHPYQGKAADRAGNEGASSMATAKVDTALPTVSATLSPPTPNGDNGWYTLNPTLTVSAIDPNGTDASGVSGLFYSIDGTEQPYTTPVTISGDGVHACAGRATDVAGNSGSTAVEVKIDTSAPVFAGIYTQPESLSLSTLTASWECADPDSDIAEYEYSIYRETGDDDELVVGPVITNSSWAQETNLGLTRGQTYYFRVRAKNNAGLYTSFIASEGILANEGTADLAPSVSSGGVSVNAEARTSTNYLLVDSMGQLVVDTSTSGGLTLESGYWHSDVVTTDAPTVASSKAIENGKLITLGSPDRPVVVTVLFADRFYVEQPDRSSGIAAQFGSGLGMSLAAGDRVWVIGTTGAIDGERVILDAAPTFVSHADPLGALFVSNSWLGGSDLNAVTHGIDGAAGLNNIGLLIRTCGRVTQVDPAGAYFYIDDGAGLADGTYTLGRASVGVRIAADGGSLTPSGFVAVTGVSSCFTGEDRKIRRLIRPLSIERLQ